MTDLEPSSSTSGATHATGPSEPQICKTFHLVEESELKAMLAKTTIYETDGYDAPGLALEKQPKTEFSPSDPLPTSGSEPTVPDHKVDDLPENVSQKLSVVNTGTGVPWTATGVLFVGSGLDRSRPTGRGTAVLVQKNIIITAATLIPVNAAGGWWATFVPGFNNGVKSFGSANVINGYGHWNAWASADFDYAVLELDTPLGNTCGWMGIYTSPNAPDYLQFASYDSIGYSVDAPIGVIGLPIQRINGEDASHKSFLANNVFDTRTNPNWHGAPLYGADVHLNQVIGVLSGSIYYDPDSTNYMVYAGGYDMWAVFAWGLAHWS